MRPRPATRVPVVAGSGAWLTSLVGRTFAPLPSGAPGGLSPPPPPDLFNFVDPDAGTLILATGNALAPGQSAAAARRKGRGLGSVLPGGTRRGDSR